MGLLYFSLLLKNSTCPNLSILERSEKTTSDARTATYVRGALL